MRPVILCDEEINFIKEKSKNDPNASYFTSIEYMHILTSYCLALEAKFDDAIEFILWCAPLGKYDPNHEPTKEAIGQYARDTFTKLKKR